MTDSPFSSSSSTSPSCAACLVSVVRSNANQSIPSAGQPLRWQLPAAAQGSGGTLHDVALMFKDIQHMHHIFVTYMLLQSVVMVMLQIRWLSHLAFQARLAVIARTLGASWKSVVHFLAPFLVCITLIAGVWVILMGGTTEKINSYGNALITLILSMFGDGDSQDVSVHMFSFLYVFLPKLSSMYMIHLMTPRM